MASTYTTNLGIEKPGTGEQSGTWGTTANTNYDLIDQAINGIVQVTLAAAGSSGSPNSLSITNGTASDGRNKYIEFVDGGDLGATAYVQLDPNDAEKIVHMRNSLSGSRSVIVFQGTYNASNDFEIPAGKDVVLKFDGGGASATVTQVFVDLKLDALDAATVAATTGNITTVNSTTVDTTNLEVTNLKAKDGTSAGSIADSTGVVTLASAVLTTADINGGTMDGVTIGGASTAAGSFTTVTASGRVTFGELKGTGATVVNTILDEDNMSTNSDTALATQQSIKAYVDSQVAAQDTLAEILAIGNTSGANNLIMTAGQSLTTDSILETSANNGVNIDSVVLKDGDVNGTIGQVTAKAANFTTMAASSNATVGGTLGVTGATTLSSSLSVSTGAVFNEGGGDNNFRVESDTNEYALFVDAGLNVVTVGNSSPENWYSGYQAFQVGLVGSIASNETGADTDVLQITSNAYLQDVSTLWKFMEDSVGATRLQMLGQDIEFLMSDAAGAANSTVTWHSRMSIDTGGTTFNEVGADYDFRVESDTNTHALFVDAGNSRVGINTSSPLGLGLTIDGGATTGEYFYGGTNNRRQLVFTSFDTASLDAGHDIKASSTSGRLTLTTYNTTHLTLDAVSNTTVFNEDGTDQDFRVESDSNTTMLFVDAGTDQVKIGSDVSNWTAPALIVNQPMLDLASSTARTTNAGIVLRPTVSVDTNGWYGMLFSNSTVDGYGYTLGGRRTQVDGTLPEFDIRYHNNDTAGISRIYFASDSTIVNNDSGNFDFRVESDNETHMLFVDAGNDRVGIGTSSPATALDVNGTVTSDGLTVAGDVYSTGSVYEGTGSRVGTKVKTGSNTISFTLSCSPQGSLWRHGYIILKVSGGDNGSTSATTSMLLYEVQADLTNSYPTSLGHRGTVGSGEANYTVSLSSGVLTIADSGSTFDNMICKIEFGVYTGNVGIT